MIDLIKQKTGILIMHKATNYAVIALIFAAALSYVYFANMAVRTLTVLEKTKGQMQSLSIEVSEMESERLALENSINTKKAMSLGFVEIVNQTFVMRSSQNISLSLKK